MYGSIIYVINRSSYPDQGDTPMETEEGEEEVEVSENMLDTEGYELVLPSGEENGGRVRGHQKACNLLRNGAYFEKRN